MTLKMQHMLKGHGDLPAATSVEQEKHRATHKTHVNIDQRIPKPETPA